MSLLYYGEVWLTMGKFSKDFSSLMRDLDITANLTFITPATSEDGVKAEHEEVVLQVDQHRPDDDDQAAHIYQHKEQLLSDCNNEEVLTLQVKLLEMIKGKTQTNKFHI